MSVFHRTRLFTTPDNVSVLFKEAHDLFGGGNLFTMQDPADGLVDDFLRARQEGLQDLLQPLSFLVPLLVQLFLDATGRFNRFSGHFKQFLVVLPARRLGCFALLAQRLPNLASPLPGCLGEVFKRFLHIVLQ